MKKKKKRSTITQAYRACHCCWNWSTLSVMDYPANLFRKWNFRKKSGNKNDKGLFMRSRQLHVYIAEFNGQRELTLSCKIRISNRRMNKLKENGCFLMRHDWPRLNLHCHVKINEICQKAWTKTCYTLLPTCWIFRNTGFQVGLRSFFMTSVLQTGIEIPLSTSLEITKNGSCKTSPEGNEKLTNISYKIWRKKKE